MKFSRCGALWNSWNPRHGDINFFSSDHSPHLPWLFLHHFFVDPRLSGFVLIPRCLDSVCDPNYWQWPPLHPFMHSGKHNYFLWVSHASHSHDTWYHHPISLESYRVLFTTQCFILRCISRFYLFTFHSSAGHYLKPWLSDLSYVSYIHYMWDSQYNLPIWFRAQAII
jgi:hypothetical protein